LTVFYLLRHNLIKVGTRFSLAGAKAAMWRDCALGRSLRSRGDSVSGFVHPEADDGEPKRLQKGKKAVT
jgi:hypothetical protein